MTEFVYNELNNDADDAVHASCRGGGRITFGENGVVKVYGFSYAYGMADHEVSAELIK